MRHHDAQFDPPAPAWMSEPLTVWAAERNAAAHVRHWWKAPGYASLCAAIGAASAAVLWSLVFLAAGSVSPLLMWSSVVAVIVGAAGGRIASGPLARRAAARFAAHMAELEERFRALVIDGQPSEMSAIAAAVRLSPVPGCREGLELRDRFMTIDLARMLVCIAADPELLASGGYDAESLIPVVHRLLERDGATVMHAVDDAWSLYGGTDWNEVGVPGVFAQIALVLYLLDRLDTPAAFSLFCLLVEETPHDELNVARLHDFADSAVSILQPA